MHHYVRLNVAGIGITARLGVTFTSTMGRCFVRRPRTGSPHRCVVPNGTTVGGVVRSGVHMYNDRKGTWLTASCGLSPKVARYGTVSPLD